MITLRDITGHESGAIYYPESGEILICNWSGIDGIPRQFVTGLIGMGDDLTGAKRAAVPQVVKRAMIEHARDEGSPAKNTGYRAWDVNGVTVVIQKDWA